MKDDDAEEAKRKEVEALFAKVCNRLDAMSNFHFTPKAAVTEIAIKPAVPAIQMEETIPMGVAEEQTTAPQDVLKATRSEHADSGTARDAGHFIAHGPFIACTWSRGPPCAACRVLRRPRPVAGDLPACVFYQPSPRHPNISPGLTHVDVLGAAGASTGARGHEEGRMVRRRPTGRPVELRAGDGRCQCTDVGSSVRSTRRSWRYSNPAGFRVKIARCARWCRQIRRQTPASRRNHAPQVHWSWISTNPGRSSYCGESSAFY